MVLNTLMSASRKFFLKPKYAIQNNKNEKEEEIVGCLVLPFIQEIHQPLKSLCKKLGIVYLN
jgi:hypothetical protein